MRACACCVCITKPAQEQVNIWVNGLAAVLLHVHMIAGASCYIHHQAKRGHTYKYAFALVGMQADHMHASILTFAHANSVFDALSNVPRGQLVHCSKDLSQYVPTLHYVCMHLFMLVCKYKMRARCACMYVCMYVCCSTNHLRTKYSCICVYIYMHDMYTQP